MGFLYPETYHFSGLPCPWGSLESPFVKGKSGSHGDWLRPPNPTSFLQGFWEPSQPGMSFCCFYPRENKATQTHENYMYREIPIVVSTETHVI